MADDEKEWEAACKAFIKAQDEVIEDLLHKQLETDIDDMDLLGKLLIEMVAEYSAREIVSKVIDQTCKEE